MKMKQNQITLMVSMVAMVGLIAAKTCMAKPQDPANSQFCLQRVGQLDKCLPKLVVYGDRNFQPPRSEEQLDDHCEILDDNLKCVSSYSRECLPAFARNLYSVVTRRLKTQFAKRCKSKDGRRDFLNLMACADAKHMEPAHKCMDSFVAHLEHIGQGGQNRQIELTCCTFQIFQDCIFTVSKKMNCAQRVVTAEKSIDYVKTIINSMGGDMMDLMCGKYDSIRACQNGYPKFMNQFKNITSKILDGSMRPQSSSPLKPMLQLFINQQDE